MKLQLESNMILGDYKQYMKKAARNDAAVGIHDGAAQLQYLYTSDHTLCL